MTDFNPGPGWRRVDPDAPHTDEEVMYRSGPVTTWWVREAPLRPLPTAENTVIRVRWARGARAGRSDRLWLADEGWWIDMVGTHFIPVESAEPTIGDFEVLAEPIAATQGRVDSAVQAAQRDTAKAVIEHIEAGLGKNWDALRSARRIFLEGS